MASIIRGGTPELASTSTEEHTPCGIVLPRQIDAEHVQRGYDPPVPTPANGARQISCRWPIVVAEIRVVLPEESCPPRLND